MRGAEHYLDVAKKHLSKVHDASGADVDWDDLTTYGLYCLEASIRAVVTKKGLTPVTTHWQKVRQARKLHEDYGLPDIRDLLEDLNDGRKANAYGDTEFDESEFDANDIARQIEEYYEQCAAIVNA